MSGGGRDALAFLHGGGQAGRLIAAHDWSATPIGPPAAWPQALRLATGLVLRAPQAMALLWGARGTLIYNDAYGAMAGARHPEALGRDVAEAWPELAGFHAGVLDACFAGRAVSFKDQRQVLRRGGVAEDAWFDLSFSPVAGEDGAIAGVLAIVAETTARVRDHERDRVAQAAGQFGAFEWFPDQRRLAVSDAYRALYGLPAGVAVTEDLLMALVVPEDHDLTGPHRLERDANPLAYVEYRIVDPGSGAVRWIARRGEVVRAGDTGPRFLGAAWDITEHKLAELQEAFVARLGERLREQGDPREAMALACEMLGRYLEAGRVGYGEIDAAGTHMTVCRDWTDGRMASIAGRHVLEAFGASVACALKAGESVRIDDAQADPLLIAEGATAAFAQVGIQAGLAVPLIRDGRFVGCLYVHCAEPRHWQERDEAVLRAAAARLWDALGRAEAEQRLRVSEEKFRQFAEAMPNQVWSADPAGQLDWFNQQVYAYSGAAVGALDGERWISLLHPDDVPAASAAWQAALRDGATYEAEFRLRATDGAWRWHIARALPIRDASGRVARWIGTNTDIEDQRRMLSDLARLNATLEHRIEARTRERDRLWALTRDPLLIADRAGTWLSVSPAWTALLGWSRTDLIGRDAAWMQHPQDPPLALAALAAAATADEAPRQDIRLRDQGGAYRWFSWSAAEADGLLYCVARDITAEKAATQRLRDAEEALRQAQKMEAVGQLTGGIAHDFNNLLTGIIGSLDLVRRRIASGRTGDLDRFMEAATASAQRAAALTHRLLAFARRQPLDARPIAVAELVDGMEELLRRTLGEQVALRVAVAPGAWQAMADPNQLENAILNLAINARDAMPEGGLLAIAAANADPAPPGLAPGDYVAFSVTDTGTGMPAEVIERAFEPFFTTKPIGKGTGLGLSMVYGFAQQSGGQVRIDSAPGRGTTVTLYLPRAQADVAAVPAAAAGTPRGGGESVLVVEDEPAVRLLVVEVLDELGYRTAQAPDAAAAMAVIEGGQPIDLMVTDVGLPGTSGCHLATLARARRPALKVLFITGYVHDAVLREGALDAGMALLRKPFSNAALAAKVSEMLAEPWPGSPAAETA